MADDTYTPVVNPLLWKLINFIRRHKGLYSLAKGMRYLKKNGIKQFARVVKARFLSRQPLLEKEIQINKNERLAEEKAVFPKQVKISIITSLHNTPEQDLKEMAESVLAQTYKNWEFCLADESEGEHGYVGQIIKNYAEKDNRIQYCKIDRNPGTSAALNKAIEICSGEYIGVLDQGDVLHPSVLYEVMQAICREGADFIYSDEGSFSDDHVVFFKHHKPDYAFDTLCSCNYISHFTVFSGTLINRAGAFRSEFNGSHDYDLILRYTDVASKVYHISKLLYFYRSHGEPHSGNSLHPGSGAENAIKDHLERKGINAKVEKKFGLPGFYRVTCALTDTPRVSIVIPNKDNIPMLRKCLSSIIEKTTYHNYEIIIVENNSTKDATFSYYEELKQYPDIRVVYWEGKGYNYSKICNFGVQNANGQQLVFLNNDIEIITPAWIEEMLMYSQRTDVGAVGIKLYFLNNSVQHAGMVLGLEGIAGHVYLGASYDDTGYMARLQIVQNMSAVTAACMMIKRPIFEEIGQFDPEFPDSFNDIDLCLKARKAGYLVVWTPYAEAYHLESRSRGYTVLSGKKRKTNQEEIDHFKAKWYNELTNGDSYYNRNFSLEKANYSLIW